MKFTSAIFLSLLSVSALAAPAVPRDEPQATFALSNDMTGAYKSVSIPLGKTVWLIPELFSGSSIDKSIPGQISFQASSISLVGGLQFTGLVCALQNNGPTSDDDKILRQLTPEQTYQKLGSDPNRLEVVELANAFIQCDVV